MTTPNQTPNHRKRLAVTAAAVAATLGLGVAAVGVAAATNSTEASEAPNAQVIDQGEGREGARGEANEGTATEGPEGSRGEANEGTATEGPEGAAGGGESGEAAGHEAGGEGSGGSGEPGESGTQYSINQTFDETQSGARLVMNYDPQTNAFVGTVQNTTNNVLPQVRVEVHLSNGTEIGPTVPVDLAPGQVVDINLPATAAPFTGYSAHPEVG